MQFISLHYDTLWATHCRFYQATTFKKTIKCPSPECLKTAHHRTSHRTSPHITAHDKFMGITVPHITLTGPHITLYRARTVPHITLRGPHITLYRLTNSRNRNGGNTFAITPVCGMRELCQCWHLCLYILISGDVR